MAFLGKVYKYQREENFGDFLSAVGFPDDEIKAFLATKPTSIFTKNGDEYSEEMQTATGPRVNKFKSGVEFDDFIKPNVPAKNKYRVEGNKITQEVTTKKGSATFVREFTDTDLVVTVTSPMFNGVAKRFYKV